MNALFRCLPAAARKKVTREGANRLSNFFPMMKWQVLFLALQCCWKKYLMIYKSCCFCRFSLLFLFCFLGFSSLAKINFAHTQSHTRLNILLLFLLSVPIFASLSLLSCKFVCAEQTTQTGFAITHTLIRNRIHLYTYNKQTFMQIFCWLAFVSFFLKFSYGLFVVVRSFIYRKRTGNVR